MNAIKFNKLFDQKTFMSIFRFIIILFIFIFVITGINMTLSRYESSAISSADAKVAFFIITQGTYQDSITLTGLVPSDNPYLYRFKVSNTDGTNRCQVNMTYTIKFITTTNLPVSYEILRNEEYSATATNIITSDTYRQDDSGTYFRYLSNTANYSLGYTSDQTDNYVLVVNFPKTYENNPDNYQSLIDNVAIEINAKQVV
jgi:hypothetical protein